MGAAVGSLAASRGRNGMVMGVELPSAGSGFPLLPPAVRGAWLNRLQYSVNITSIFTEK